MQEVRLIGKPGMVYFYVFLILEIVSNVSFSHFGVRDVLMRCMLALCCLWSQGSCFLVFVMLLWSAENCGKILQLTRFYFR